MFVDAAEGLPELPPHIDLPTGAMPFWRAIVGARSKKEWSSFQLTLAAQLARTQYEIELRTELMERDGVIVHTSRENPMLNPLHGAIDALTRRQLALVRSLQLAGVGDPRTQANRDKAYQQAQAVREELAAEDEGLLA